MNTNMTNMTVVLIFSCFLISTFHCSDNEDKLKLIKLEQARIINALAGANMTSLEIQASDRSEAALKFGSLNNFYSFTARGEYNDFLISNGQRPIIQIDKENNMMIFTGNMTTNAGVKFTGDYKVRGVPQWKLVHEEDLTGEAIGWTNNTVTECGGVRMLGGYCQFGGGEVFKLFEGLPPHQSVRIQATYHFIDAWDTESGFMRVNNGKDGEMQYLWVERYSAFIGNNGINICGGRWPEGKFAAPIDVVIPHKLSSIKIGFGSSIEQDPCDESFGVSGIRIYIR